MKRNTFLAALAAAALVASSASALILGDKTDEQKLRKDIQKQQSKLVDCYVKAALKCEKDGTSENAECSLSSGTGPDSAAFQAAIAKCESKVDYTKKSFGDIASDYDAIGCPGDSDSGTAGDQPYSDLLTYQSGASTSAKGQIDAIGALVGGSSGCNADPDPNKCSIDLAKAIGGYAKGVYKCLALCENDYKNKKGNGGPTDGTECALDPDGALPYTAGSAEFNECTTKARAKADKKGAFDGGLAFLAGLVHGALADANTDLFNENEVCP